MIHSILNNIVENLSILSNLLLKFIYLIIYNKKEEERNDFSFNDTQIRRAVVLLLLNGILYCENRIGIVAYINISTSM